MHSIFCDLKYLFNDTTLQCDHFASNCGSLAHFNNTGGVGVVIVFNGSYPRATEHYLLYGIS